jgi:hypothetical protein
MKIIRYTLLGLIVIGVGLLLSQQLWLPSFVAMTMPHEETMSTIATSTATSTTPDVVVSTNMAEWNWVYSEASAQGVQFLYPDPLPTRYVAAPGWPPAVVMTKEEFTCDEASDVEADGITKRYEERMIGDREYCVGMAAEGAAGSTFTSYEYLTAQEDVLVRVTLTLRTPQCMNYNEPEQTACTTEQANFDVDGLVDRIVASIKRQ